MNLISFLDESKILDFKKGKESFSKENMKYYHDALFDIIEDYRKDIAQNDKTKTILFLLLSAQKEMRTYIEKEE